MSFFSSIRDRATVNSFRNQDERLRRLEGQISTFIKNNSLSAFHSALLGLDFATAGHTGFASTSDLNVHTGDATIHFTEASIDHLNILSIGTNSHATIDAHIANTQIHSFQPLYVIFGTREVAFS